MFRSTLTRSGLTLTRERIFKELPDILHDHFEKGTAVMKRGRKGEGYEEMFG